MRRLPVVLALRLFLLVAIAASSALVIDYRNLGDPAFCGTGSGCFAVRLSPVTARIGHMLPISLPNLGLLGFVLLFGASLLLRTPAAKRMYAAVAGLAGLAAATLLVLQGAFIKAWCPWCVAVDASAIGVAVCAAILALQGDKGGDDAVFSAPRARVVWSLIACAAIGTPFLWAEYPVIPPIPQDIAAQQLPGKLTLVEFTDFECPYCRALHPVLRGLEDEHPGKIALIRRMMPLASHSGALPAALLYLCAPDADKERVADALYTVDESELTRTGCLDLAAGLGLDRAEMARAMDAPETRAALDRDRAMFERLGAAGLPRTFIGQRVVMGYNPEGVRRMAALELGGKRPELPVALMFVALGLLFAGGTVLTERWARGVGGVPAG